MATPVPKTTRTLVVACPATAKHTVQLDLDEDIRTVSIQGYDATGEIPASCFYSFVAQAEDTAPIDANRKTVDAGGLLPVVISGLGRTLGGTSLHVASSEASGVVELIISTVPFA